MGVEKCKKHGKPTLLSELLITLLIESSGLVAYGLDGAGLRFAFPGTPSVIAEKGDTSKYWFDALARGLNLRMPAPL